MFCPDSSTVGVPYRSRVRVPWLDAEDRLIGLTKCARGAGDAGTNDDAAVAGRHAPSQENHGAGLPAGGPAAERVGDIVRCSPERPAQPDGGAGSGRESMTTLWMIATILIALWVLGPATGSVLDLLVHVLLAFAIFTPLLIMKDLAEEEEAER